MASNVIKARTLDAAGGPVVVKRSVLLAYRDASEIVAQARDEAERIVSEARDKAQGIFDSAREDGYQNGAGQWNEALIQAFNSRDEYMAGNEAALLKLSVRIAKKLIGEELHIAPDAIAGIVREALRSTRRAKSLTIQVHPADANLVNERLSSLHVPGASVREIEVIPNGSLAPGDCVVESEVGVIDARLETQLKNMERVLTLKMST